MLPKTNLPRHPEKDEKRLNVRVKFNHTEVLPLGASVPMSKAVW